MRRSIICWVRVVILAFALVSLMAGMDHQPKSSSVVVSAASSTSSPPELKLSPKSATQEFQTVKEATDKTQFLQTSTVSPWSIVANYPEMMAGPAIATD